MDSFNLPPNPEKATTVIYSKTKTKVGTTKDSIYFIREQFYEVKEIPGSSGRKSSEAKEDKIPAKSENSTAEGTTKRENTSSMKEERISPEKGNEGEKSEPKLNGIAENRQSPFEGDLTEDISEIQLMSRELDAIFEHRLCDIETKVPNNLPLRIKTYQEWIETLLKRNAAVIESIKSVKEQVGNSVELLTSSPDRLGRSYRDRDVLVKFIQQAFHNKDWNLDLPKLETVTLREYLKRVLDSSYGSGGSGQSSSRRRKKQKSSRI